MLTEIFMIFINTYRLRLSQLLLFLLLGPIILPVKAKAGSTCIYCGSWIEVREDTSSSSEDRLMISELSLTLPGCSSVSMKEILLTDKTTYSVPEDSPLKPLRAILKMKGSAICPKPLATLSSGTLVSIELRPGVIKNSERLVLSLFPSDVLDELRTAYKEGRKWVGVKPLKGYSWFIREGYDICLESGAEGVLFCGTIKRGKAEEDLKSEWREFLDIIPPEKRDQLISLQEKWRENCTAECRSEREEHKGAYPWPFAEELMCLVNKLENRTQKIRDLHDCIQSGKVDCPVLSAAP